MYVVAAGAVEKATKEVLRQNAAKDDNVDDSDDYSDGSGVDYNDGSAYDTDRYNRNNDINDGQQRPNHNAGIRLHRGGEDHTADIYDGDGDRSTTDSTDIGIDGGNTGNDHKSNTINNCLNNDGINH